MTATEFDSIQWRSGMWIAIGNLQADVVSVDLRAREIAIEDKNGLVWINSEYVTLKKRNNHERTEIHTGYQAGPVRHKD